MTSQSGLVRKKRMKSQGSPGWGRRLDDRGGRMEKFCERDLLPRGRRQPELFRQTPGLLAVQRAKIAVHQQTAGTQKCRIDIGEMTIERADDIEPERIA